MNTLEQRSGAAALLDAAQSALAAIRAHKLRSFLTALGVVIGVASVIAVVSLIQGFSNSVTAQFKGLGSDSVIVYSNPSLRQQMQGRIPRVTMDDLSAVAHQVPGITFITPVMVLGQLSEPVSFNGAEDDTTLYGTTSRFPDSGQYYPTQGRFISATDDIHHRRVCVIGVSLAKNLGLGADALGQYVQLRGESFKVVGVLNERGELAGMDQDNLIIIPYGTAQSIVGASAEPNIQIRLNVEDIEALPAVTGRIAQVMRARHKLAAGDPDDFKVQTASQLADSIGEVFDSISLLLAGIVGISLFVGGVGIMNIMLVSVTERTREIGICKSLGATRRDILAQFLFEAAAISILGGIIGLMLGYAVGLLVSLWIPSFGTIVVPAWAICLSLGVSAATGIVFGIAPAAKAASLDPILALRYE
jgi:putative ABC transport system permease protein